MDTFECPPEMGVEAVREVVLSLQGPQRDVLATTGGKASAGRLQQEPTASSALMRRMHVQPHDVPDASRIVIGVLSRAVLAEADDFAIFDHHQHPTPQPEAQIGMLRPVAVPRPRDPDVSLGTPRRCG